MAARVTFLQHIMLIIAQREVRSRLYRRGKFLTDYAGKSRGLPCKSTGKPDLAPPSRLGDK